MDAVCTLYGRVLNEASTKTELNSLASFKSFKKAIRENEAQIPRLIEIIIERMKRSGNKDRERAIWVIDFVFTRSHNFRLHFTNSIKDFLDLACEADPLRCPLPGPSCEAGELKKEAMRCIKLWHEKYAIAYPKLNIVHAFLMNSKSVDFEQMSSSLLAERQAEEERNRLKQQRKEAIEQNVTNKFSDINPDIIRAIFEAESALQILVPSIPTIEEDEPSTSQSANIDNVTIVIKSVRPNIVVNEDNIELVNAVRDASNVLQSYQRQLSRWISRLTELGSTATTLRQLTESKQSVTAIIAKISELETLRTTKRFTNSSDEESDLEDVPEKELEEFKPPDDVPDHIMQKIAAESNAQKPCTSNFKVQDYCDEAVSMEDKADSIPRVSYGIDLEYWGKSQTVVEVPRNNFDGHRFWRHDSDEPQSFSRSLYSARVMTYVGPEVKAQTQCRAPLSNGKLCPRMDRSKCPLHGPHIERDSAGFPVQEMAETATTSAQIIDNDSEYIRDVEQATGRMLTNKSRKRQKDNVPEGRATRQRLEVKLQPQFINFATI